MKKVTVFDTTFNVNTPQTFMGETVNIEGAAGNIYADFYFVHSTEGRIEVACFDSRTGELKEEISGVVEIEK